MQLQDVPRRFSPAVFVRPRNRFETRGSLPRYYVDMPEIPLAEVGTVLQSWFYERWRKGVFIYLDTCSYRRA